ncbi:MAG: DNA repair protein RadC [bacterium]
MSELAAMPKQWRPRERLDRHGAAALQDAELIAIVLGHGTRGRDALEVARSLLSTVGSLADLAEADPAELGVVMGVGPATAARLTAAIELGRRALAHEPGTPPLIRCAKDVHRLLRPSVAGLTKEVFWAIGLNARHVVRRELRIAEGSLANVDVHPREVFRPLIRMGAAATILAHNHPSGDPTPSGEDIALTMRLREVGELTGIPVLDHVVITVGDYASLAELALL